MFKGGFDFMKHIPEKIIKHRKIVLGLFFIAILLSVVLSKLVNVNYDLIKYLPKDLNSTVSLEIMKAEFTKSPPNARVLIKNVTIPETLNYKKIISEIQGVREVTWLDHATDIYVPVEMMDIKLLESYYKDNNALFILTIDTDKGSSVVPAIREVLGEYGEITGDIVDNITAQTTVGMEASKMLFYVIPLILVILLFTTSSWFEPILFLAVISVSIIINAGTNALLGEISFITKSTAAILQLAVSMDYSIFLLHSFQEFRKEGLEVQEAMIHAMKKSFSSIFASGITTILGFLALTIMRFKIGTDLGIVLSKGIIFSMLSIMCLLPVLTIFTYKIIDKTRHPSFLPSFEGFGKFAIKAGTPILIVVAILILPSFLAQHKNDFMYGFSFIASSGSGGEISETSKIFGKTNTMVLLVPKGDIIKEKALNNDLNKLSSISAVISYINTIGSTVPVEIIPSNALADLQSANYSRLILTVETEEEGEGAFKMVEAIRALAQEYYNEDYYLTGGSVNVYDMKKTVIQDSFLVTIAAIIGITLVLLISFRSLTLPLILLFTIEASIWINLAFPYFMATKMAYLGFMIISSILLGATVDYAILFTHNYIENRLKLNKENSVIKTIADTTGSILTSAAILTTAGFTMNFVSTNTIISQLGMLIARGTILSTVMVLFMLPTLLILLDKLIEKSTLKLKFYKGE